MKGKIIITHEFQGFMDWSHGEGYKTAAIYIPQECLAFWEHNDLVKVIRTDEPKTMEGRLPEVGEVEVPDELVRRMNAYLAEQESLLEVTAEFCTVHCAGKLEAFQKSEEGNSRSIAQKIRVFMETALYTQSQTPFWSARTLADQLKISLQQVVEAVREHQDMFRTSIAPNKAGEPLITLSWQKVTFRERMADWFIPCRYE